MFSIQKYNDHSLSFQLLASFGVFFFVFALYETFEYLLCYKEEKTEQSKVLKMLKRIYRRTRDHIYHNVSQTDPLETEGLLSNLEDEPSRRHSYQQGQNDGVHGSENIPLDTFRISDTVSDEGHLEKEDDLSFDLQGQQSGQGSSESNNRMTEEVESSFINATDNH